MKVGLVIYGALDRRSGGYLYDAKLVEHLRACGDEVKVFSLPETPYPLRFAHNLKTSFWRQLARANLDVLLQDELNHPSLLLGNRWLRRQVAYPIVAIVHHLYADEWEPDAKRRSIVAHIERMYLASIDGLICNSRATWERARQWMEPSLPSVVAPPGGDRLGKLPTREAIRQRADASGPLRVLFIGNVIPRKQLEVVLRGLALLPHEQWSLRVIGDLQVHPAYARRMQRLSERLGLEDNVSFCGRLSDEQLHHALSESHVLALLSHHEGFGIAFLEAMAYGNAVIANQKSFPKTLLQDGLNSFLIEACPFRFADILQLLIENRMRLCQMALRARTTFEAHPSWDESGATIRRFLKGMHE